MWYLPRVIVMRSLSCLLVVLCCLVPPAGAQEQEAESGGYRVGIGDVIEVQAFQEEEISGEFSVEESGAITFPLLGTVPVAGMTPAEISAVLETMLEKDYYVDVQLKVEVEVFASQPVTLLGEVQTPGTYYLEGRTSLTELLAKAGGLKSSAGPVLELRRTARSGAAAIFSRSGTFRRTSRNNGPVRRGPKAWRRRRRPM